MNDGLSNATKSDGIKRGHDGSGSSLRVAGAPPPRQLYPKQQKVCAPAKTYC